MKEFLYKHKTFIVLFMNIFQFIGWSLILLTSLYAVIIKSVDDISLIQSFLIKEVRIVQTMQLSDIIFSFFKFTSTSTFSSAAQVVGRLITVWFYMDDNDSYLILALFLIPWSISDCVRSLYYVIKDVHIIGVLRYNLFLILYPIGMLGEQVLLFSKEEDTQTLFTFRNKIIIKAVSVIYLTGLYFLYRRLLDLRKKFYENKKNIKIK